MKDIILKLLREKDDFISGEEISGMLGVTRTAVWKYINVLRKEGYTINSYSKKGYKLCESPDLLTPEELGPLLKTKYMGRNIVHFNTIDSTNNAARIKASEGGLEGLAVVAEEQTSGKGRMGRAWSSPKFTSIAFSLILRPNIKPSEASRITLVMGAAVCRAIRNITSLDAGIKWPNDIIVNGKKVCGILTEMSAEIDMVNHIIIGTGINVNVPEFPEALKDNATSLYIELGNKISRKELLSLLLLEFEGLYEDFKLNGLKNIIQELKSHSVTLGRPVKVVSINESFLGEAVDISEDGLLIVRMNNGEKREVISGDISVRGLQGYI